MNGNGRLAAFWAYMTSHPYLVLFLLIWLVNTIKNAISAWQNRHDHDNETEDEDRP